MATYQRPQHPVLARRFDEAVERGWEVRYADDTRLVVWRRNELGCGGLLVLLLLGLVTAFIVPVVLLVLGALSPSGQIITYTVTQSGKVKKKSRAGR